VIVLKDNVIVDRYERMYDIDLHDRCVSRHYQYYELLFAFAKVEIVEVQLQEGFPEELYPVYMFTLRPIKSQGKVIVNDNDNDNDTT